MAELTTSITVTGVDFVIDVIQKFMDNTVFKDNVPEVYQDGFYDFGNAIIKVLKEMPNKRPASDNVEIERSKDCIHFGICKKGFPWADGKGGGWCEDFKDKENFVEVVKCKDCEAKEEYR